MKNVFLFFAVALFASATMASNPTQYGNLSAIPNDGVDDGPGFRAAVTAACGPGGDHFLEVPVGVFEIDQEYNKLGGLNIHGCAGLSIVGKGRSASRIRMVPKTNTISSYDYYLFNLTGGSSDIEIADLTLDGRQADFSGPAEQIHLIRTHDVRRLDLHDMDLVSSYGAGIKNITSYDVAVVNVRFRNLLRGGFEAHSNTHAVRLVASSFDDVYDQHISSEGGGGNNLWTVVGNNFGAHGPGTYLSADFGSGQKNLALVGNTFLDNGVQGYSLDGFAFVANVFDQTEVEGTNPIYLKGRNTDGTVSLNVIRTVGSGNESMCLRMASLDMNRDPSAISVVGNLCKHGAGAGIGITSGLGKLALASNVITSTATGTVGSAGITVSQLLNKDQRGVVVNGNVISNESTAILVTASHCTTCTQDDIAISGNAIHSTKLGAEGMRYEIWNHLGIPYTQKCRGDANVIDVPGNKWSRYGTVNPQPNAYEGCVEHGDAVP